MKIGVDKNEKASIIQSVQRRTGQQKPRKKIERPLEKPLDKNEKASIIQSVQRHKEGKENPKHRKG